MKAACCDVPRNNSESAFNIKTTRSGSTPARKPYILANISGALVFSSSDTARDRFILSHCLPTLCLYIKSQVGKVPAIKHKLLLIFPHKWGCIVLISKGHLLGEPPAKQTNHSPRCLAVIPGLPWSPWGDETQGYGCSHHLLLVLSHPLPSAGWKNSL